MAQHCYLLVEYSDAPEQFYKIERHKTESPNNKPRKLCEDKGIPLVEKMSPAKTFSKSQMNKARQEELTTYNVLANNCFHYCERLLKKMGFPCQAEKVKEGNHKAQNAVGVQLFGRNVWPLLNLAANAYSISILMTTLMKLNSFLQKPLCKIGLALVQEFLGTPPKSFTFNPCQL